MKKYQILPYLFIAAVLSYPMLLGAEELQNWFHDPFFQISDKFPDCPQPAGPYVTAAERLANAHHRAERGTTCWLEGKCDRPNSYAYDQDIGDALQKALAGERFYADSSLWVTVQGRVVYIEGCAADKRLTRELEKFAMTIPYVETAVAKIRFNPLDPPPYTLFYRQ